MNHTLTRILLRLERGTRALAVPLARRNDLLLVGFSMLFFLGSALIASQKLLWFDELFTYHLAKLSVSDLWAALNAGVDLNPPLNYLLTRGSHELLGDHPAVTRLPAFVGFWVLLLCLYHFVAYRCGRLYGWLAMLIPLATWAYSYAHEARPYGVVMGCCGVALVCWQRAADGAGRWWALPGLALSLAAATATHYYAVLLWVPLGLGELIRTVNRRRVDWLVGAALGVGLAPLVVFLPLIRLGASYAASHTERPRWSFVHDFYQELLGRSLLPLVVLLLVAYLCLHGTRLLRTRGHRDNAPGLAAHEIALMAGLLAMPLVGIVLAKLGSGAFGLRYVVSAVAGVALLGAVLVQRLSHGSTLFGGAAVLVLLGWSVAIMAGDYQRAQAATASLRSDYAFLSERVDPRTSVLIPGPITYLQMHHYAPPDLARRLLYVAQPGLEASYFDERRYSVEGALLALHRWKPLSIAVATTHQGRDYYVFGPGRLTEQMETTAARLELRGRNGRNLLFFTGRRLREVPEISRLWPSAE